MKSLKFLIFTLLISFLFTGISLSRFSTTYTSSDTTEDATVSNPVILYIPQAGLADSNNNKILTLNDIAPGSPTKSYYFNIVNHNGTNVSDMVLDYTVTLDTLSALPLDFKIYDLDKGSYITLTRNTSTQITMASDTQETHRYRLDINWRSGVDDFRYSDEIDYVNIIIDAQQAE